jgi:hypothetical protein
MDDRRMRIEVERAGDSLAGVRMLVLAREKQAVVGLEEGYLRAELQSPEKVRARRPPMALEMKV